MKKRQKSKRGKAVPEMLPEYRFDYRKARPNRFAGRAKNERSAQGEKNMVMPVCPNAPKELPAELMEIVRRIARKWANHPNRPRPRPEVIARWDQLIAKWCGDRSLPLFVRKSKDNKGQALPHSSGRTIVPSDNSPAHWAFALALLGKVPGLKGIRSALDEDRIPVALVLKKTERRKARYRCTLREVANPNNAGWKVAHVNAIGLADRKPVLEVSEARLEKHFRRFMSPRNMFVVPKAYAGLAELREMCDEISKVQGKENDEF